VSSLPAKVLWSAADKAPRMVASIPDTSISVWRMAVAWEPGLYDVTTVHSPWCPLVPTGRNLPTSLC
jgi:hypothetical protein